MTAAERRILEILDRCCESYTFPMLDNGYVYLAATRLSLFRSSEDWAMVIEVFGFSPRAGLPDLHIHTFSSRLHDRDPREKYVSEAAFRNYLAANPHNDSRFVFPIAEGSWQNEGERELVAASAREVTLRGRPIPLPDRSGYARHGIELVDPSNVLVYELCRYLAAVARDDVLATTSERRVSVGLELVQLLQLEEWNHPDVVDSSHRPSGSPTFQQLARALVTGDAHEYHPSLPSNTHWSHWPDGGSL